jgi:hypothetical protein
LEVIEIEVVVGVSRLDGMVPLQPAQVHVARELVVAELERVGAVVVAEAGKRSEVESRLPT